MIAIIIYVISPANKPARRHSVPTYPALPYNCFFYVTDLPMNFPKTAAFLLLLLASLAAHALDTGRIPQNEIAVYVQELDSGKVIIDHRSDVPVNPASTMKLVTAFAAFKTFGSNYRWATEFKSNGTVNDGTLDGNLYWAGSGDPVFNQENLLAVQRQLREQGIRNITGHLMLDHSLWGEVGSPDDFEADSGSPFMTPPNPTMLSAGMVMVRAERNAADSTDILTDPPLPHIFAQNNLKITASQAACPSIKKLMRASFSDNTLKLRGNIPESCLGKPVGVRMFALDELIRQSFTNHWLLGGGRISDGIGISDTPEGAQTLAVAHSKPMKEILTDMNKRSDNLIARSVFLKLGGDGKLPAVSEQAASAVRRELAVSGIDVADLVLENGSGLSRKERVTARMMAQMLETAYFSPFAQDFIDTLPIAGTDGTLRNRFKQSGGLLRLKTGTLNNVRALAGYWLGDKPMAVVVIINSGRAVSLLPDLDNFVANNIISGGDGWLDAKLMCKERRA